MELGVGLGLGKLDKIILNFIQRNKYVRKLLKKKIFEGRVSPNILEQIIKV